MKIKQKKTHRKKIAIVIAVLLVALFSYSAYAYNQQQWPFSNKTEMNTKETSAKNIDKKVDGAENEDTTVKNEKTPLEPSSTEKVNDGSIESPNIVSAKQLNDKQVRVSANFAGTANGTCELTLSKTGESDIVKSANIIVVPSGYACNGFLVDIPTPDNWKAVIVHKLKNLQNTSPSVEVN